MRANEIISKNKNYFDYKSKANFHSDAKLLNENKMNNVLSSERFLGKHYFNDK